jgi:hypothetical protein
MLSSDTNAEECDATNDDSSNAAGFIKKIIPVIMTLKLTLRTVLRLTESLALVKLNYLRETPQKLLTTRLLVKKHSVKM